MLGEPPSPRREPADLSNPRFQSTDWTVYTLRQEPEPAAVVLRRADQALANLAVRANLLAEVGDDLVRGEGIYGGKGQGMKGEVVGTPHRFDPSLSETRRLR